MTVMAKPTVADLINEALETVENPSPDAIARVVAEQLDDDQRLHFLIRGLTDRVRAMTSARRHGKGEPGAAVSSRWTEVAKDNSSGALDFARKIARIPIFTGEEHRWLPDCTYDDLVGAVGEQESQAQALLVGARKLTEVAEMVKRKRGANTVADLDAQKVWEALNA